MDTVAKLFGVKLPTVYKLAASTKAVSCAYPQLVVGMELETENATSGADWYEAHLRGPWVVSTDGSLRGRDTAFEFISKPISLEYMIPTLANFFETTKFTEKNYSDRCSVHVHTNVTDFTQEQLATLSLVYTVIEDVLFQYVNHFKAPTEEGYCRDTNIYCIPWSQCRANMMLVNNLLLQPVGIATHRWQKYTALNLLPIQTQGTVEWRHMHGTANIEKLTLWLNILGSIMKFSKEASFEDVVKTIKVLNDNSAYQQFFNSILQGYLHYDETYRGPMADGVINAKNGLINWELNKNNPKAAKAEKATVNWAAETVADIRAAQVQQAIPTRRVRNNEARFRGVVPPMPAPAPIDWGVAQNAAVEEAEDRAWLDRLHQDAEARRVARAGQVERGAGALGEPVRENVAAAAQWLNNPRR